MTEVFLSHLPCRSNAWQTVEDLPRYSARTYKKENLLKGCQNFDKKETVTYTRVLQTSTFPELIKVTKQSFIKPLPLCIVLSARESQEIQSRKLGLSSRGHKNDNWFLRRMFYDGLVGRFCHGYQTRRCVSDVKALRKNKNNMDKCTLIVHQGLRLAKIFREPK